MQQWTLISATFPYDLVCARLISRLMDEGYIDGSTYAHAITEGDRHLHP
jgi:hypothetical protein